MELLIVLLCLAAGGFVGYKAGVLFIKRENSHLTRQVDLLSNYNNYWSSSAAGSTSLFERASAHNNIALAETLKNTIQLLSALQTQSPSSITPEQQHEISQIISEAQNALPPLSPSLMQAP